MTIKEVYEKFEIPPNLAEHMLTVARVAHSLQEHWNGEEVDFDFVIKSALLHDIGNIVKFKLEGDLSMLGEEAKNVEHWKEVQKRVIEKYGADDHGASGNMLKEIGVTGPLWDVIQNKSFANAIDVAKGDDWYAKILLYADMRVMPHGVATLEERLADVRNRMPQYYNRPDFEELLESMRDVEKQIAENLDSAIADIAWGEVTVSDEVLLATAV